jgi:hypothetical protein
MSPTAAHVTRSSQRGVVRIRQSHEPVLRRRLNPEAQAARRGLEQRRRRRGRRHAECGRGARSLVAAVTRLLVGRSAGNGTSGPSGSRDAGSWSQSSGTAMSSWWRRSGPDSTSMARIFLPLTMKPGAPAAVQTGQVSASEASQRCQLTRLTTCRGCRATWRMSALLSAKELRRCHADRPKEAVAPTQIARRRAHARITPTPEHQQRSSTVRQ